MVSSYLLTHRGSCEYNSNFVHKDYIKLILSILILKPNTEQLIKPKCIGKHSMVTRSYTYCTTSENLHFALIWKKKVTHSNTNLKAVMTSQTLRAPQTTKEAGAQSENRHPRQFSVGLTMGCREGREFKAGESCLDGVPLTTI